MPRLSHDFLEKLKEEHGVDRIWSYSRWSTYFEHPWEYKIKYIDKIRTGDNIYSYFGTICHDIIQDYYEDIKTVNRFNKDVKDLGEFKSLPQYKRLIEIFEDKVFEWKTTTNFAFIDGNVENNYIEALTHYFKNTTILDYELTNELPILYVSKYKTNDDPMVFIGYIDSIYKDSDGIFHLVDYKTSSKSGFSGKSLKQKSRQLLLYAMGVHQKQGVPYEKMNLRFDMMKYANVEYLQKNGKWRASKKDRHKWVADSENNLRKALTEAEVDLLEIEDLIEQAKMENTLECMPKSVQERFKIGNCYIDVPVTQEDADELDALLAETCEECMMLEKSDNLEEAFPEPVIDFGNQFYYKHLSGVLKYHKGYQESLKLNSSEDDIDDDLLDDLFD